ncbi:ABC transporter permease [Salinibacterium sp. M195]|uniref:ABC transporter permease n=1 Tax=Salinibacterium sp. M195 TaxID=2583374 RepID=UPI001C631946|nr:ABC transporter permease [Salinibacterium sp. M195]
MARASEIAGPRWGASALVRSEALKLWSLRAPRVVVLFMFLVPVVLAVIRVLPVPLFTDSAPARDAAPILFESIALGALPVAFFAAILGIISMSSEYTDDVLAGSLTAVPRRSLLLLAKAIPATALAGVITVVGSSAAAWIAAVTLESRGYLTAPWGDTVVVILSVAGGGALFTIVGISAAALVRTAVTAVLIVLGVVFLLPRLLMVVAGDVGLRVAGWLPAAALQALTTHPPAQAIALDGTVTSTLSPGEGLIALVIVAVILLGVSLLVFLRRRVHRVIASGGTRWAHPSRRHARRRLPGATFGGVLRSEALKALTMPAVRWLLALSWVVNVWLAYRWAAASTPEEHFPAPMVPGDLELVTFDQTYWSITAGLALSHFLIAGVGAVIMTSDFSTGNIRPALAAVPSRGRLILAKVVVAVGASLAVAITSLVVAAPLVTETLQRQGYTPSLFAPILFISIAKGCIALGLTAAIGSGLGILVRSAAGTLLTVASVFFVFPYLLAWLQEPTKGTPFVWFANISQLFPDPVEAAHSHAANEYYVVLDVENRLHFWPEHDMPMLVLWAVGTVLIGWLTFRRRGV